MFVVYTQGRDLQKANLIDVGNICRVLPLWLHVDILRTFPKSVAGNSYILTVGSYFTCWMEVYSLLNHEVCKVVKKVTFGFFFWFCSPSEQARPQVWVMNCCQSLWTAGHLQVQYHVCCIFHTWMDWSRESIACYAVHACLVSRTSITRIHSAATDSQKLL